MSVILLQKQKGLKSGQSESECCLLTYCSGLSQGPKRKGKKTLIPTKYISSLFKNKTTGGYMISSHFCPLNKMLNWKNNSKTCYNWVGLEAFACFFTFVVIKCCGVEHNITMRVDPVYLQTSKDLSMVSLNLELRKYASAMTGQTSYSQ